MQTSDQVLMVRPVNFLSNPETAGSNAFQVNELCPAQAQAAAVEEFDRYVERLRHAGVGVLVVQDTPAPATPDSIFPNNWVSFAADGNVFLYPMEAPNRRQERRVAILGEVEKHFRIRDIVDLSHFEKDGRFLEGTGSMVLDHVHRIAYVCHSSRSHPHAVRAFEQRSGYRAHCFHAVDRHGKAIYHTNVMMSVGSEMAIVCFESIGEAGERAALRRSLESSGKRVMDITLGQVAGFAGNMIELRSQSRQPVMAMSNRAWNVLSHRQKNCILDRAEPVLAPIDTIERLGGGSARCMVAEIFLPRRTADLTASAERPLCSK